MLILARCFCLRAEGKPDTMTSPADVTFKTWMGAREQHNHPVNFNGLETSCWAGTEWALVTSHRGCES